MFTLRSRKTNSDLSCGSVGGGRLGNRSVTSTARQSQRATSATAMPATNRARTCLSPKAYRGAPRQRPQARPGRCGGKYGNITAITVQIR
eukprot:917649-Prorocentrum_minimum.AAC.1